MAHQYRMLLLRRSLRPLLIILSGLLCGSANLFVLGSEEREENDVQEEASLELELVGELPWWADEDGSNLLSEVNEKVDVAGSLLTNTPRAAWGAADQQGRGASSSGTKESTGGRRATEVSSGFCLPHPKITSVPEQIGCQSKGSRCGGQMGTCCDGLTCRNNRRCRRDCQARGLECALSSHCCSQNCVFCNAGCQGRCGLGVESPRDNIQTFYYPWYGNTAQNGKWRHWAVDRRVEGGAFDPLHKDIPSNFYPRLGAYSSSSPEVISTHMQWMKRSGIGTLILSWWGTDSYENSIIWNILNAADDNGLKVGFYIEPYSGGYLSPNNPGGTRTPQTASDDVKYIIETYGCHRAMYRRKGRPVFLFFAARTYAGNQTEWKQVWDELHVNPKYNPVVIAHDVNLNSRIIAGGWDGGHDYGTAAAYKTSPAWQTLSGLYAVANKTLYLTVSPGYDKTRIRDTTDSAIDREDGLLYNSFWARAIAAKNYQNPVVITSFNEWHEGTQIEPADPTEVAQYLYKGENRSGFTYDDYEGAWGRTGEDATFSYIDLTKEYADIYLADV